MRYFILRNSTGDDIGNVTGIQIEKRSPDYPYNEKNSFQFLPNLAPPEVTPNFDYLIVEKKANMTDFISCIGIVNAVGFIISERAKQLFEQFNLMPCNFYPARLLHRNKFYEYFWMHLAADYINHIDYSKSSFVIRKPPLYETPNWDEQKMPVEIDSPQTIIAIRKQNAGVRTISPVNLFMNGSFNNNTDLFAFSSFDKDRVIISEKLGRAIIDQQLTGIELRELPYPLIAT